MPTTKNTTTPGATNSMLPANPLTSTGWNLNAETPGLATATSDDLKLIAGKYLTLSQAPTANEQTVWLAVSVSHAGTQPQSQKEDSASGGGSYYDSTLELIPQGATLAGRTTAQTPGRRPPDCHHHRPSGRRNLL